MAMFIFVLFAFKLIQTSDSPKKNKAAAIERYFTIAVFVFDSNTCLECQNN